MFSNLIIFYDVICILNKTNVIILQNDNRKDVKQLKIKRNMEHCNRACSNTIPTFSLADPRL
jgi:hypothetical protein